MFPICIASDGVPVLIRLSVTGLLTGLSLRNPLSLERHPPDL